MDHDAVLVGSIALPAPGATARDAAPRIRISDGTVVLTATLERSAAVEDFLSMLPLSLAAEDYARKEKIAYLPRRLQTSGAPAGIAPAAGDVAYYAPWGNLAISYDAAPHANGLVRLGRLEPGGAESLRRLGVRLTIERID